VPVPNSSAGDRPGVVTNGGPTQEGCARPGPAEPPRTTPHRTRVEPCLQRAVQL